MKISYKQIESYCNELHSLAQNMKETLENIDSIGNVLLNGGVWSGAASENYIQKLKSVTKNFDEVFVEIENSILYMANCAEGYHVIDQNIIKEICSNLQISEPHLGTSNIFNR